MQKKEIHRVHLHGTFNSLVASMLTSALFSAKASYAFQGKNLSHDEILEEVLEQWIFFLSKMQKTNPDTVLEFIKGEETEG